MRKSTVVLLFVLLLVSCGSEHAITKISLPGADASSQIWPEQRREREFTVLGTTYINGNEPIQIISDDKITPDDLNGLQYLDNPILLDLRGPVYTLDEMQAFTAAFPDAETRFSFELAGFSVDWSTEELDLSNIQFSSPDEVGDYLPYLPNLKELVMCDCGISDEDMALLRDAFPNTKFVWMLHIGGEYSFRTDIVAFSTLRVYRGKYYSEDFEILKYCTDLKALDLGHLHLTSIEFLRYVPELRVLILADNSITDISPIADLHELRYLELFMNNNIESYEPLRGLEHLEDLNLSFDYGTSDYEPLWNIPNLQRLWMCGCKISAADKATIRANVPEGCTCYLPTDDKSTGGGWRDNPKFTAIYYMFRHNYIADIFMD